MRVLVSGSNLKGNAPPGYVAARVVLAPGLFVDAELNPYTNGEFKQFVLFAGDEDAREADCKLLASFEGATVELAEAFNFVRDWFAELGEFPNTEVHLVFKFGSAR